MDTFSSSLSNCMKRIKLTERAIKVTDRAINWIWGWTAHQQISHCPNHSTSHQNDEKQNSQWTVRSKVQHRHHGRVWVVGEPGAGIAGVVVHRATGTWSTKEKTRGLGSWLEECDRKVKISRRPWMIDRRDLSSSDNFGPFIGIMYLYHRSTCSNRN